VNGDRLDPVMMGIKDTDLARVKPEERDAYAVTLFRELFTTPRGAQVLMLLLADLRFFGEARNPDEVALKNYATTFIRERLGVTDPQLLTSAILTTIQGART
jgi:hypothetical protein